MARPVQTQLTLVSEVAAMDAREDPYIGYSTQALVHCTLPYRSPGKDARVWTRRNGDLTVQVQPGLTIDGTALEIPSGSRPRILLAWIGEQVMTTREPEINLGRSLSAFMDRLGIASSGGKTGSRAQFVKQLRNLAGATILIHWGDKLDPHHELGGGMRIARAWNVRWGSGDHSSHPSEDSKIVLDPGFFDEILKRPVPLNMEALKILSGSAMQLDLYAWLTSRMFRLSEPVFITWESLRQQFGNKELPQPEPGESQAQAAKRRQVISKALYDFKRDMVGTAAKPGHLRIVLRVYHEADVRIEDDGVWLFPSPPHVALRGTHGLRRTRRAATLPARQAAALAADKQLELLPAI